MFEDRLRHGANRGILGSRLTPAITHPPIRGLMPEFRNQPNPPTTYVGFRRSRLHRIQSFVTRLQTQPRAEAAVQIEIGGRWRRLRWHDGGRRTFANGCGHRLRGCGFRSSRSAGRCGGGFRLHRWGFDCGGSRGGRCAAAGFRRLVRRRCFGRCRRFHGSRCGFPRAIGWHIVVAIIVEIVHQCTPQCTVVPERHVEIRRTVDVRRAVVIEWAIQRWAVVV